MNPQQFADVVTMFWALFTIGVVIVLILVMLLEQFRR